MATEWYYAYDGEARGPFEADIIRAMAASGDLKPADRVCRGLHGKWFLASQVKGLEFAESVAEPDAATDEDEEEEYEENPNAGFFRFASPTCWCAAIVFFFLPWVDSGCGRTTRDGSRESTMSGAQIAWGGETHRGDDGVKVVHIGPPNDLWETPRGQLGCLLLSCYFLGLVVFAVWVPFWTPCRKNAVVGFLIALALLGCLFGGCSVLIEVKSVSRELFLRWYYASYIASVSAVVPFFVGVFCLGKAPNRRVACAPSRRAPAEAYGFG